MYICIYNTFIRTSKGIMNTKYHFCAYIQTYIHLYVHIQVVVAEINRYWLVINVMATHWHMNVPFFYFGTAFRFVAVVIAALSKLGTKFNIQKGKLNQTKFKPKYMYMMHTHTHRYIHTHIHTHWLTHNKNK